MRPLFSLLFALIITQFGVAQQEARLLRFPTASRDAIVFSYAGDLYTVSIQGGLARKLTSDVGNELFARFSPDGKTIAFTGQYDGNTEVYTIPAEGGIPKRLTYTATLGRDEVSDRMGPNNIVMTWKPDNSGVVYRSRKTSFNDFKGQLYIANINGGLSTELPFSVGGFCSYNADMTKLAMNQVFREFRTWKYYRGGMADDIHIYDFATGQMENITNNNSQDIIPMWHGNKIYYLSDRDRTMNLFEYDVITKLTRKVTTYTEFDIKFPSLGNGVIVYENGGFIYAYDLNTSTSTKVNITISDDAVVGRNEWVDAASYIESGDFDLGPDGNRMAMTARGDIWTLPSKEGITRNLTKTPGVHERSVAWSPDGQYVAYISDATGEDEIYIQKQDGSEAATKLTSNADTYKYSLTWSPDSKKILWDDKKLRLQYVDVSSKTVSMVDQANSWEHGANGWSPDGKWITFTKNDDDGRSKVYLHEVATKKTTQVTDNWYEAIDGTFSPDGKYLYFISNRDFNPTYSNTEWNHSYADMSKVYLMTLAKATPSPFGPKNDEVSIKKDTTAVEAKTDDKAKAKDKAKEEAKPAEPKMKPMVVDLDGITDRVVALPLSAGNYYGLSAVDDAIYYMANSTSSPATKLKVYNIKDKKEAEVGEFNSYIISVDRKKMLLQKGRDFAVVDLPKDKANMDKKVDMSNTKVLVDRKQEWHQIYNEAWRQMRDFFYDPGMHGVDWMAMKQKYAPLVPYVNHRADLSYIIGELIGELNVGHAYVGGGDFPKPERIQMGLLGAQLSRDASGYYKIDKIMKGENWMSATRSPLTEVGVDVKEGEYILAINGVSTKNANDIYELLVNTANKTTEITTNSKPDMAGSKKSLVVPTNDEGDLYYLNWVRKNIDYVTAKTNGQVGYIHVPDMSSAGLNEFVKYFYPQLNKKALIIDDRGNGGGNVSPQILERLARKPVFFDLPRNTTVPVPDPALAFGPKVMLVDQYSASDGDIFPYRFRANGLGKIIGRRTWGGVVGIRGSLPFIDGGFLNRPEFAGYDVEGKTWPLEGHGIDPDIVVINNPADEYKGMDAQLDRAIEVILEELKTFKGIPAVPPYPRR
jgi:tricorn protease